LPEAITIPGFTIEKKIDAGGMATVFLGKAEENGSTVAIKVMAPALVANAVFCDRFIFECRLTGQLDHPNIVHIPAFGCVGNTYYMVMEYLAGGSLEKKIKQGLSPAESIEILIQVASALDYAHGCDVIHRDIKPPNVLFRDENTAVLSDFGIAKAILSAQKFTSTGMIIGTPVYMSPEQAAAKPIDKRSDLYSVGVMFYEMLTGKPPYTGDDPVAIAIQHRDNPVPSLPPAHAAYQPLIDRLLAKDPARRYQDAMQLQAALAEFTDTASADAPTMCSETLAAVAKDEAPGDNSKEQQNDSATRLNDTNTRNTGKRNYALGAAAIILGVAGIVIMTPDSTESPGPVTEPVPQPDPPTNTVLITPDADQPVSIGSTASGIAYALDLCRQHTSSCPDELYSDEKPRKVLLKPYRLDATEVTNARYKEFTDQKAYETRAEKLGYSLRYFGDVVGSLPVDGASWRNPDGPDTSFADIPDYPVTSMTRADAEAFCRWANGRLPTADEWEYAAKGENRKIFPWGDTWNAGFAHWGNADAAGTVKVMSFPQGSTSSGLHDLSGNVWEWTSTEIDGMGVMKGGSWLEANPANLRSSVQRIVENIDIPNVDDGFRCAYDISS